LGKTNINVVNLVIKEYKKFEKQKITKRERILILEKVKKEFFTQKKNELETFNELEIEKTFVASKKYLDIGILGLSILAIGDFIASQMTMRIYNYFLVSHNLESRRTTTLAIGLLYISNPQPYACDSIIKLTNDSDLIIIKNAIFSLGLIGAGTTNTRVQTALKCLADYYSNKIEKIVNKPKLFNLNINVLISKIQSLLFIIRVGQGLVNSLTKKVLLSVFNDGNFLNFSKIVSLVYVIYGVSSSKFIGFNSIPAIILLLSLLTKPNFILSIDDKFKLKSFRLRKNKHILNEKFKITPILTESNDMINTIENKLKYIFF
jgi:26S proteasome regulatory subunit N1